MQTHWNRNVSWRWLAAILALAMLIAACGGDDDAGMELSARTDGPPAADGGDGGNGGDRQGSEAVQAERRAVLGTGGVEPIAQPADLGRDIIYTADVVIAVADVAAAGQETTRIMARFNGLLFGQQTEGLPEPRSVLVFKVSPEDFQAALAALGGIGDVRSQTVSADDVTEIVVDLESRITTAETSVARLQGFLENATDIKTIAELEAQLVERETTLEQLRGQLRTLEDQVALATITVTLTEAFANPNLRIITSGYLGEDGGLACPGSQDLLIDEGQELNLCFEIRNNGDTTLTGFTFIDRVLEISIEDLTVIDGSPTGSLDPGQSLILATTIQPDRRVRTQTTVTAVPVNDDGSPIETRTVSQTESVVIAVEEPEGMPGFDDGVRVATAVLQWVGGVIVIAAGLAIPFLWLIPLLALLWWWRRRRKAAARAAGDGESEKAADEHESEEAPVAAEASPSDDAAADDAASDDTAAGGADPDQPEA
jgi:hypothetical protein